MILKQSPGVNACISSQAILPILIIETINDQLKNISQIEHSPHRSPVNFCVYFRVDSSLIAINRRNPAFRWNGFYLKVLNPNSGYYINTCWIASVSFCDRKQL